jgi:hypothetical protein
MEYRRLNANIARRNFRASQKIGTSHLHAHLKSCVYNQNKKGVKIQTNLRFATSEKGQVAVENYVFNQDVARRALYFMIILHEYPLSPWIS